MKKRRTDRLGGLAESLLKKWEKGTRKKATAVTQAWESVIEQKHRDHTRPVKMKKGVLTVVVDSSPWLYEMTMQKMTLLEKFNKEYKGTKKAQDIRFRVGNP